MKIVFAYNCWSAGARAYHEAIAGQGRAAGLDIATFIATPAHPRPRYSWAELDRAWATRDRALCRMKDALLRAVDDADVFWLYNGANVHPAWLAEFPRHVLTVYGCFDDPESSDDLSRPVARYFDAALVGNIAAIPLYQGWGCRHVAWGPIFLGQQPPQLSMGDVAAGSRPVGVAFCGERESPWRRNRLAYLRRCLPEGRFYGRGWPEGFCTDEQRDGLYRAARIGLNVHNSVGPINIRLFALPAFGVMQVCDNKSRLGHVFKLGREAVGFDTAREAVELVRYYLDHEQERADIAWRGHLRYQRDYAPAPLWQRYARQLREWRDAKEQSPAPARPYAGPGPDARPGAVWKGALRPVRTLKRLAAAVCADEPGAVPAPPCGAKTAFVDQPERLALAAYQENPPVGPVNFAEKTKRVRSGGFFEWPNMVALNWAVATLVQDAKNIIEVGGGTGCFAYEAAQDPARTVLCLEDDPEARAWAAGNRSLPNILYDSRPLAEIASGFDLLVSVDVIEHVKDYNPFLAHCRRLARRAVLTTPNRFRETPPRLRPEYRQHVREWSAGEFYYTLKAYWDKVALYGMPDVYVPVLEPIDINSTLTPLIAVCE